MNILDPPHCNTPPQLKIHDFVCFPALQAYFPVPYMSRGLTTGANGATSSRGCGALSGQKRKSPIADVDMADVNGAGPNGLPPSMPGGVGVGLNGRSKKPRLIWTAELHARFLNAVNTLGVKNAVPKTILQLMNVEGMTRENVASHLQKYRLYLKRCSNLPPGTVPSDAFAQMMGAAGHMFGAQPMHQANAAVLGPMQLGAPTAVTGGKSAANGSGTTTSSPLHQSLSNGGMLQQAKPAASGQPVDMVSASAAAAVTSLAPMNMASSPATSLDMLGALSSQLQAQQLQQLQVAMAAAANGHPVTSQPQAMIIPAGAGPLALLSAASRGLDPLTLAGTRALHAAGGLGPSSAVVPLSMPGAQGLLPLSLSMPLTQGLPTGASVSLLPTAMGAGNLMTLLQAQQLIAQASGLSTCTNNQAPGPQVITQAVS